MSPSSSMLSSSSSSKSRASNASSIRHALELEGYDASRTHARLLQEQDVANDRAEAERLARKAALYASIGSKLHRVRWVLIKYLHIGKRPAAIAYDIPQVSLDHRQQVYVSMSIPPEPRVKLEAWDRWDALLNDGPFA